MQSRASVASGRKLKSAEGFSCVLLLISTFEVFCLKNKVNPSSRSRRGRRRGGFFFRSVDLRLCSRAAAVQFVISAADLFPNNDCVAQRSESLHRGKMPCSAEARHSQRSTDSHCLKSRHVLTWIRTRKDPNNPDLDLRHSDRQASRWFRFLFWFSWI